MNASTLVYEVEILRRRRQDESAAFQLFHRRIIRHETRQVLLRGDDYNHIPFLEICFLRQTSRRRKDVVRESVYDILFHTFCKNCIAGCNSSN